MSSMLQSYMNVLQNPKTQIPQTNSQDRYRIHIKALRPTGHLLDTNPFSLKEAVQNDIKSLQYFANGIQGRGNDYSVGKINDVAIKLGSLGIAGIIATSKGSPFQKGMEFVGLTCWLGAMSLWSKIAINLPLKHLKGVNLDQEYLTSRKLKKNFYQDPQFICWDMYTDEQINKMGDKLGVPKNIKNRRKAVENKAKQIAIQGNTLAMLTAGIATPVAASLFADKIGKHIYSPIVEKLQTLNADSIQTKMKIDMNNLLSDKKHENAITSLLKTDMTHEDINKLFKSLEDKMPDKDFTNGLKDAFEKIMFSKQNTQNVTIDLNEDINKQLATIFAKDKKNINPAILSAITETSSAYENKLSKTNLYDYISSLGENLVSKKLISAKDFGKQEKNISNILNSLRNVSLKSSQNTMEQLINLSRLLTTYDIKYNKYFNQKYYQYVWNDESSVNAKLWEKMKSGTMKIFGFDGDMLKKIANAPSDTSTQQMINEYLDNFISNPAKYDKAITDFSNLSAKLLERNEKYLKFSLDYLDSMQHLLTAYDKNGEFSELISNINSEISAKRKKVIGKYLSANNNIFAPLKTIITLKEASGLPKEQYKTLQNLLVNNQTVDAFINKLDHYQDTIKNADDYWKVLDRLFAPLPASVKEKLPAQLAEKIDATTILMRHLLTAQSDTVNIKYQGDRKGFFEAMKKFNFDKYLDEFYTVSFAKDTKNPIDDTCKNIVKTIIYTIENEPSKLEELKTFLNLSDANISDIKAKKYDSLYSAISGNKEVGAGYLNSGRYKFRTLIQFFEDSDVGRFGASAIGKSKENIVTKLQGATLKDFIKDTAKDMVAYNGWVKKIGLTFIGLCAVTGIALLNMGKKNEFNPDIYQKRSDK